jgi:hypothetical protein
MGCDEPLRTDCCIYAPIENSASWRGQLDNAAVSQKEADGREYFLPTNYTDDVSAAPRLNQQALREVPI